MRLLAAAISAGVALSAAACRLERSPGIAFEPEARALTDAPARDPAIAVTRSGAIWALLAVRGGERGHEAELRVSHDGGDSYAEHWDLSRGRGGVESHGETAPLFVIRNEEFVALWIGDRKLWISRSTDFGKSFGEPAPAEALGNVAFFTATLGADGTLLAAWLDHAPVAGALPGTASLISAASADGGRTFSPPLRVATNVCPCCRPAAAITGKGTRFLGWRSTDAEQVRDVAVARSTDGGAHWTEPRIVSRDGWKIAGCPHAGPALAADGEMAVVAWTTAADGLTRSFWSRSDDGQNFTPRREIAPETLDASHPVLAAWRGRVFVALQARDPEERSGWGKSRIYLGELGGRGATGPIPAPAGPGSALYPKIEMLEPAGIFVAWTDSSDQGTRAYAARARLAP